MALFVGWSFCLMRVMVTLPEKASCMYFGKQIDGCTNTACPTVLMQKKTMKLAQSKNMLAREPQTLKAKWLPPAEVAAEKYLSSSTKNFILSPGHPCGNHIFSLKF